MVQNSENRITDTAGRPSVYRRGAEDGLVFGIYLAVLIVSMMLSVHFVALSLVAMALAIGVPVLVYRYMRRGVAGHPDGGRFAETCMHGISLFFFGALIMGVVMYVYLHFFDDTYIVDNMRRAIIMLKQSGSADNIALAHKLQNIIDHKLIPGVMQFVFTTIWFVVFTGSILSMLLAPMCISCARRRQRTHISAAANCPEK